MEDVRKKPFGVLKASFIALFASVLLCVGIAFVQTPEKAYAAEANKYLAEIEFEKYGTVTVELDRSAAPITVDNFVNLSRKGFYNGLTIHRIADFCIQGGDPKGNGSGGSATTIKGEFSANGWKNKISHKRGVISMARSDDYNSASSQFFITTKDSSSWLDGKYAAFGRVVSGMDVIDSIVSNTWVINEQALNPAVIKSIKITPCVSSKGWIKSGSRWWYKYDAAQQKATGKKYPRNEVIAINGKWYSFDKAGWMKTGWQKASGKWYYYGSDGAMKTGWQKVKGKWYFLNSAGVMQTGKKAISGKTYYLTGSGAMKTGWNKESGKWYCYKSSGEMYAGILTWVRNGYYFFDWDGSMKTGLQTINENKYYFASSGAMKTGWQKISGKWYYFNKNYGNMLKNRWISGKYWVGSDGVMATNAWVDNGKYYVDRDGKWVKGKKKTA